MYDIHTSIDDADRLIWICGERRCVGEFAGLVCQFTLIVLRLCGTERTGKRDEDEMVLLGVLIQLSGKNM